MTDAEFDIWYEAVIRRLAEEDQELLIALS